MFFTINYSNNPYSSASTIGMTCRPHLYVSFLFTQSPPSSIFSLSSFCSLPHSPSTMRLTSSGRRSWDGVLRVGRAAFRAHRAGWQAACGGARLDDRAMDEARRRAALVAGQQMEVAKLRAGRIDPLPSKLDGGGEWSASMEAGGGWLEAVMEIAEGGGARGRSQRGRARWCVPIKIE